MFHSKSGDVYGLRGEATAPGVRSERVRAAKQTHGVPGRAKIPTFAREHLANGARYRFFIFFIFLFFK